jgi:hypothetical protein
MIEWNCTSALPYMALWLAQGEPNVTIDYLEVQTPCRFKPLKLSLLTLTVMSSNIINALNQKAELFFSSHKKN